MRAKKLRKKTKPVSNTPFTFGAIHKRWVESNVYEATLIADMLSMLENEKEHFQQARDEKIKSNELQKQQFLGRLTEEEKQDKNILEGFWFDLPEDIIDEEEYILDFMRELSWHDSSTETMRNITWFLSSLENIPKEGCKDWSDLEQYKPHSQFQPWLFQHLYQQMKNKYVGYLQSDEPSQEVRRIPKPSGSRPRADVLKDSLLKNEQWLHLVYLLSIRQILPVFTKAAITNAFSQLKDCNKQNLIKSLKPYNGFKPETEKQVDRLLTQLLELIQQDGK